MALGCFYYVKHQALVPVGLEAPAAVASLGEEHSLLELSMRPYNKNSGAWSRKRVYSRDLFSTSMIISGSVRTLEQYSVYLRIQRTSLEPTRSPFCSALLVSFTAAHSWEHLHGLGMGMGGCDVHPAC